MTKFSPVRVISLLVELLYIANFTYCVMEVEVVTLGSDSKSMLSISLIHNSPAINTAVKELRESFGSVFNITHTYLLEKLVVSCLDLYFNSDFMLSEWYYKRKFSGLRVFIAPACNEYENVNRLTAGWNMLMFTSAATGTFQFRNKIISPTRVTTGALSLTNMAKLLQNTFSLFGWKSIYMVVDASVGGYYTALSGAAVDLFKSMPDTQLQVVRINPNNPQLDKGMMQEFGKTSRIFIYMGYARPFRRFLVTAAQMNMTNGEFVYICIEQTKGYDEFTWKLNDQFDEIAREAFRSVLILSPDDSIYDLPPENLCQNWTNDIYQRYNVSVKPNELYWTTATAYAAFKIFGTVLNETIITMPTFDFNNGKEFAKLFFNRTYELNFTDIFIDNAGERITKLLIKDMDKTTGNFKIAIYQDVFKQELHFNSDIDWGGSDQSNSVPLNQPLCGYRGDHGPCAYQGNIRTTYAIAFGTAFVCIFIASAIGIARLRKWAASQNERWWDIDANDLGFPDDQNQASRRSKNIKGQTFIQQRKALLVNEDVWVDSFLNNDNHDIMNTLQSRKMLNKLAPAFRQLRTQPHMNINAFRGICISPSGLTMHFVSNYCQRGSLLDLFERFNHFDVDQCSSLALDFLNGMRYIHNSVFAYHGNITGRKCLIDSRFTLKISQLGFQPLRSRILGTSPLEDLSEKPSEALYWVAPEVLRGESSLNKFTDTYSVGITLYGIMTISTPFRWQNPTDVVKKIRLGGPRPLRPDTNADPSALPSGTLSEIICQCWNETPSIRPTINKVWEAFNKQFDQRGTKNLVAKLLRRLDEYAESLEQEVFLRTTDLITEQNKCDALLQEMLPRDLVGFTELAAARTPWEVTNLLDSLYIMFDPVLGYFDVYKVETIGNVYMVASGIPTRNGVDHAKEIASLSLALHAAFIQAADPQETLYFKAGFHTGPCAAGVMGHTNPRYCLFGDTVNTASRMGSHSLPDKIHMSSASAELLKQFPGFMVTRRGEMLVKGKGIQTTFWLEK